MPLFKRLLLEDSIEINVKPEKIWDFFKKLEKNYTTWHPKDHIVFKWIKGPPLEEGTTCYAEQYVMGKVTKYNATLSEIVPNRKIVFKWSYPVSLLSPKVEWLIEPKGSHSIFIAVTHMRAGYLWKKLFKRAMKNIIEAHNKHTGDEAKNLKKILEK
ncbi:hypothetical protein AYK24_00830 [Thermoplasmatales archaeon SG8-52-4]|nr:MAG: hypothetical protein AYK24_00830 [Thermoplasmatales archaeon SG8-52-4]